MVWCFNIAKWAESELMYSPTAFISSLKDEGDIQDKALTWSDLSCRPGKWPALPPPGLALVPPTVHGLPPPSSSHWRPRAVEAVTLRAQSPT